VHFSTATMQSRRVDLNCPNTSIRNRPLVMDAGRQVTTFTLSEWQTRSVMRRHQRVTFDVSTRCAITDWDEPDYGNLKT
jgi:hypothetical protein